MALQAMRTASEAAHGFGDGLRRYARFERVLGVLLILTPLVLIAFDGPAPKDSISAYHDSSTPEAFYVPLAAGAMLFFVNGLVRDGHWYNLALGVGLLGVVLFDKDNVPFVHAFCALGFFGMGALTMLVFSTSKSAELKLVAVGGIVAAVALWPLASLFWAEWVAMAIIAAHYVVDSVTPPERYHALKRGDTLLPVRAS